MRKNSSTGFTLIELMIVIAIIGILAAIAIPGFTHAYYVAKNKERARQGLSPLKDPTAPEVTTSGCQGSPISIATDNTYTYTLYSGGCVEKTVT